MIARPKFMVLLRQVLHIWYVLYYDYLKLFASTLTEYGAPAVLPRPQSVKKLADLKPRGVLVKVLLVNIEAFKHFDSCVRVKEGGA